ncbi:hypothetical protein QQ045_005210 [Rhodiola kirilowii]
MLWCGHCKKLAPEFEKLGTSFKRAKSILIGKVDCDENKGVCGKYDVSGYPTIKWFPKGSLEQKKYEGPRTAEALAEFVNSEGGTNVKCGHCKSLAPVYEKVAAAFKSDEDVVIANLDADKHKHLAEKHGKMYSKIAKSHLAKGSDYATKEIARLERILEKSISEAKADELTLKKNILCISFNTGYWHTCSRFISAA